MDMPHMKNAPTQRGESASCQSLAADKTAYTANPAFVQHNDGGRGNPQRTILIQACVFGGRYVVTFEPRSIAWPSLEFRSYDEAVACANAQHKAHGWPVIDKTEGQHHE